MRLGGVPGAKEVANKEYVRLGLEDVNFFMRKYSPEMAD